MITVRRAAQAALCAVVAASCLVGCSPDDGSIKVALLLPDVKTARYEALDRPIFTQRLEELGDYSVLYSNADQDAAKQQSQAEAALASGVEVLVLDPVDSAAAVSIVIAANAQGVPVIAYDRIVDGGELAYYISFDNDTIGDLQAQALVERLDDTGATGGILMVNGSPTDNNAQQFKRGATAALEASGYPILAEFDTPDWSPNQAQDWVASQVTLYGDRISGVYAANDGTAGGAIAALKAAGIRDFPVVTGQDAELAAIQRIVSGDQYMTIYKDIRAEAALAAEIVDDLVEGRPVTGELTIGGTPTTLLDAQVVTVETVLSSVVADGLYTVEQICTAEYAAACAAARIR
ncbi:sugar ABC transporter substrate-binding protein [Antiquaquibacter soli]|uniref:sugar ABC transporter substrate-binding protein n=1 Tax=Antiquaquibacter soli TaxID=3064523 RepID=UPI003D9C5FAC